MMDADIVLNSCKCGFQGGSCTIEGYLHIIIYIYMYTSIRNQPVLLPTRPHNVLGVPWGLVVGEDCARRRANMGI